MRWLISGFYLISGFALLVEVITVDVVNNDSGKIFYFKAADSFGT